VVFVPAVFVPAALVRLVCFAAFLLLDFLLLAAICSPRSVFRLIVTAGGASPCSGAGVEQVFACVFGDARIDYPLWDAGRVIGERGA
jgi:hypothetical protein